MDAYVVNGNALEFCPVEDSDYVQLVDVPLDLRTAIEAEYIDGDENGLLDRYTARRVSVMTLASIAEAAVKYLSEQVNGNFDGVYERRELVDLLVMAGYGKTADLEDAD